MATFVRFLNSLLMIFAGLGVGLAAARRHRDSWRFYTAGVWTFVLSQVFHIPFNAWLLEPRLSGLLPDGPVPGWRLGLYACALGLSAGLFEEFARYLGFRFAVRGARRWADAVAYGAGHGGIEAILLGVLSLYTVLQLVAVQGPDAAAAMDAEQLARLAQSESQIAAFWSAPWYAVLLGALERVFAICFHLSAAVLVLQVFRRKNPVWLGAAVAWHAVLDAGAVYVAFTWGPYLAEGLLAVFALISLGILYLLREPPEPPPETAPDPEALELSRVEVSEDQLEDSRYE